MYNILIVDDEKIEREGIKYLIEEYRLPFEVAEAPNGKAALEYIHTHNIHILFTDIKMPFMDGLELAAKAREANSDVEIVIFSAYGEFEYAIKAIDLNVVHYILKPVNLDEFVNVMAKVIQICKDKEARQSREEMLMKGYNKSILYEKEKAFQDIISSVEMSETADTNEKVIKEVISYINNNYMSDISLESIADSVYLSPGYLSSFFKRETGKSLIKYITELRLNKARELLQNTNMKIVDIYKKVGYSNYSYFCVAFRNHFGASPAKYHRKED